MFKNWATPVILFTETNMNKQRNRRRRYFINRDFQSRFIIRALCIIILAFVVSFIAVASYFYLEYGFPGKEGFKIFIQKSHGMRVESLLNPFEIIIPPMIISAILILIVVFVGALIYSNRIAGPIYRFKTILKLYKLGDYGVEVILRQKDEFKDFAEELNEYTRGMRAVIRKKTISTY